MAENRNLNESEIAAALKKYKRIHVIGLGPDPGRPVYGVTNYLIQRGYEVYGQHPEAKEVLGRPCFAKLEEMPRPFEIIDVFRRPDAIPGVVDEIEKLLPKLRLEDRPKLLWLQLGITHPEAEEKARKLGLQVVSNRCIAVDHRLLVR